MSRPVPDQSTRDIDAEHDQHIVVGRAKLLGQVAVG